jgi:hypothetical protein
MSPVEARYRVVRTKLGRHAAHAAFIVSALALLGTSKPRGWSVAATVAGPTQAPPGRALEVTIDSSAEPALRATDLATNPYGRSDTPCLARWARGAPRSCLLPPGAELGSVSVEGNCPGCSGECAPPSDTFVKATTSVTEVWRDVATGKMVATLPSHDEHWIATRFQVFVEGARFIQVKLDVIPTGGETTLFSEVQACRAGTGTDPRASCIFVVYDPKDAGKTNVEVVAEATGWGTPCPSAGSAPCAPPKTLRVDSLEIMK